MSEQIQVTRWRFQSDYAGLVVYHEGHKIARFEGGEFETDDRVVAEALRGFDTYCHEMVSPPIPILIHNPEPTAGPVAPARSKPAGAHK